MTGGATTVTGLNGTQLSALASGILYNTTATGVPSIATAAQIIAGFGTQTANTIFAGPASGSAAAPTFRALVSADIPNNAANTTGTAHLLSNTANPWTPTLVGFTNVGTPTIYPYATQLAPGVYCLSLQIIPSTSIATVGGTSYISGTPFTPAVTVVLAGWDLTGNSTAGNAIWYVNGNIYFPTITTSTHTLVWSGCSVL